MANSGTDSQSYLESRIAALARAFRAAVRAVGFYPPSHPAVGATLQPLVDATRNATARGPVCLTVLPTSVLAGGVELSSADTALTEFAGVLHRHGIGAIRLDGRSGAESWRALLALLARLPEDVREAGGVERLWKATGHVSPAILQIDFGDLLRGRIGGDLTELAGVISHYLEGGAATSVPETAVQALTAVLEAPPDEAAPDADAARAPLSVPETVDKILRVLRGMAQLAQATEPNRFDETFCQAATIGGRLSEDVMAGLLARRDTPEALVGSINVVDAFVERLSDEAMAQFVAGAVGAARGASQQLADLFSRLVPDLERRRRVLVAAQALAAEHVLEEGFQDQWSEIRQSLETHSDGRYLPDDYARELEVARKLSVEHTSSEEDPPEQIAAWLGTIADPAIVELDRRLLLDLVDIQVDPFQWRGVIATLVTCAVEAAESGDWAGAASAAEAIAHEARPGGHPMRQPFAADALEKLTSSRIVEKGIAELAKAGPTLGTARRLLAALGPALVPVLVGEWLSAKKPKLREPLEAVITGYGEQGLDGLVLLLQSQDWETRCAAVTLLHRLGATGQLAAVGPLLADPHPEVLRAAVHALGTTDSEDGPEVFCRTVAQLPEASQMALLAELTRIDRDRRVRIFHRLLDRLDQGSAPKTVYLAIIEALAQSKSDHAVAALKLVPRRRRWTAPLRGGAFTAAAVTALGRIGGEAAHQALSEISANRAWRSRLLARRELTRLTGPSVTNARQ